MNPVTAKQLRDELKDLEAEELRAIVLRLSRFKKENKELLTYLLFEAHHEDDYVASVKQHIDDRFNAIETPNFYYIKKAVRKILADTKRFIKYSGNKETEVTLLLHVLKNMNAFKPSILKNRVLTAVYERQLALVKTRIASMHEDLQYDYLRELHFLEIV